MTLIFAGGSAFAQSAHTSKPFAGPIIGPEHSHNFAWGDDDGKTLYLCSRTGLYRIRLNIPGVRPTVN